MIVGSFNERCINNGTDRTENAAIFEKRCDWDDSELDTFGIHTDVSIK